MRQQSLQKMCVTVNNSDSLTLCDFSLRGKIDKAVVVLPTWLVACCHLGCALEVAKVGVIIGRQLLGATRVELGHLHACEHINGRLLILKPTLSSKALRLISRLSLNMLAARVKAGLPLLLRSLLLLPIHEGRILILLYRAVEELWLKSTSLAWLLHMLWRRSKRIRLRLRLIHLALTRTVPVSHHLKGGVFRIGWIRLRVLTHHMHNIVDFLLLELLLILHALDPSRMLSSNKFRKSVILGLRLLNWNSWDEFCKLVLLDNWGSWQANQVSSCRVYLGWYLGWNVVDRFGRSLAKLGGKIFGCRFFLIRFAYFHTSFV